MGRQLVRTLATVALLAARALAGANLTAAKGLEHGLVVDGLTRPRGMVEDSGGNLLVVERGKGILRLVLDKGEGTDVRVASRTMAVNESKLNHGIALSTDGKTLFASSSSDVWAWSYDASRGTTSNRRHVMTGMKQGGHETRTLLVPRKGDGNLLLVSRGSDGNVDKSTVDIQSAKSQIRVFRIDELLGGGEEAVGYDSGEVLGWGLRNSVGVGEDPTTGNIWSVENSLDNMHRHNRDIHQTNPGDELNFHGRPSDHHSRVYGRNFGYPACVAIFDASVVEGYPGGAKTGMQMTGDHMRGMNFTDEYCQSHTVAPVITLDAHLAPLDIDFLDDGSAAFISMHGSWNRKPGVGYRVTPFRHIGDP
ncbi:NHL repeat-containing protein [Ophiocordyceps camponoti-floridani]|uniref:NHL repeat-containing protein n=1 Tax=Ophiocordyceps camponoti-floridani TaxID=2030778 RepID=A0A8H4Q6C1_9HYPO|nr:NHL repeat-containing protein [Ophiocordyceps camponoti-floridani]